MFCATWSSEKRPSRHLCTERQIQQVSRPLPHFVKRGFISVRRQCKGFNVNCSISEHAVNRDDLGKVGPRERITLADPQYKRVQDWWHPSRNYPLQPSDYTQGSRKQIWLQCGGCPRCGEVHEWNPRVSDVTKTGGRNVCPYCESKAGKFCSCRSVATNAFLKREWHEDNVLPASQVSLGHQQKVKWRCQQCSHEWLTKPAFRSNDGTGCPLCGRARRTRHGSIASVMPYLLREWDFEMNEVSPESVTCGSGKAFWWICQHCQHSWRAVVKARALNGAMCPRCSQKQRFSTRNFAKDSPVYLAS